MDKFLLPKFLARLSLVIIVMPLYAAPADPQMVPDELLVKFSEQIIPQRQAGNIATGLASVDAILAANPLASLNRALPAVEDGNPCGLDRVWSLKFNPNTDLLHLLAQLSEDPQIEYAEPRYLRYPDRTLDLKTQGIPAGNDEIPNDPLFAQQWSLEAIQAASAWDITHGSPAIPLAIVDTGTQLNHPDLASNIWHNEVELSGITGVDDDDNGFVDDFYGWDFLEGDGYPDPAPTATHGTHTAGIASAATNNGLGMAGVGWSCKIMPVRTGDAETITYGIEGINYAALTGARVISCSWGGSSSSQYEQDVINDATSRGSLVVAAAGNQNSSSPHYPAACDNVTAVAATTQGDLRYSYSNYGDWVDCCAPGVEILSSVIGGGYDSFSGTSMSCPHVAGLAGLIAAQHSDWPPQQLAAQILSTCDNIDVLNPAYAGLLGAGRINSFRAVTENNPYIIVSDQGFADADGDGVIEPGESVDFWVELTNLLAAVAGVQVSVTTADPYATITQNLANFGDLESGASASNQSAPFAFQVLPTAPASHQITFALQITAAGGYAGSEYVHFTILPLYGDHDVGNVVLTVTNFGALGFVDYVNGSGSVLGSGFQYPAGSARALYHGSLLVGMSPARVSDNCYGNDAYDRYDFRAVPGGELVIWPGEIADQEGLAVFDDSTSVPPMGVNITQRSYAWAAPPDDDFVILRYDLTNTTEAELANLYAALYLDWDVNSYAYNQAGWDADSAIGYMKDDFSPYYGFCLLSHEAASYRVVQNSVYVYGNVFTDSLKYQFMTEGFVMTQSPAPDDYSVLLSAGPFTLASGATQTVAFAVLGGNDLGDLRLNAAQARWLWHSAIVGVPPETSLERPANYSLSPAYPNPFNPIAALRLQLPASSEVILEVFDVTGRTVGANLRVRSGGVSEASAGAPLQMTAGTYDITFDGTELPSGIYLCRLQAGNFSAVQKLVLLK